MSVTDHDIERYAEVDLYGVLHVTAQADADLIDRAYRVRMHAVHPDHVGAPSTDLAALVNAAGAILRQPEARARYDALRTAWRAKHEAREHTVEHRRVRDLEEQLSAARRDLAASEASRWALGEQVQQLARRRGSRRARWLWVSGGVGAIVGAVALSLALGMAGSRQVRVAPAMLPLVVPAPAAVVASPGAEAEWPAVLHELDATWEQDWPATITRLERFLDRWPGYPAAEDKLYAALVADAEVNIQAEQVATAAAELERAARRQPERGEAWARLAQLAAAPSEHP